MSFPSTIPAINRSKYTNMSENFRRKVERFFLEKKIKYEKNPTFFVDKLDRKKAIHRKHLIQQLKEQDLEESYDQEGEDNI